MASDEAGCGHPLTERFWAERFHFICFRCFVERLRNLRNEELLGKDLRNFNNCLRRGNTVLVHRLCSPGRNGTIMGIHLIKKLLSLCSRMKSLSATGFRSITFIVLALKFHAIPFEVFSALLSQLPALPEECRTCLIHLIARTGVPASGLAQHAKDIAGEMDSSMSRATFELFHDLAVNNSSLLGPYTKKLLRLVKEDDHAVGMQNILRGLLHASNAMPEILLDRQGTSILDILNPFMNRRQAEIVCGILYIVVNRDTGLDLLVANDIPFRLAELALACVDADCIKIFLNLLGDLSKLKHGRAFTSKSASKIFSVLLVLQKVTFDADVALSLLHLLTSLIDCKQFPGMRKAQGDLLLAQLDALCQGRKDVPEIGTAALKCFGCSLVTDKLPSDVSFDRCLSVFAKCIRAFEEEKITFEHFVDCATEFSKWSVRVKNESRQRMPTPTSTPTLPVEFVPDWIDNFVLELLKRLLFTHEAAGGVGGGRHERPHSRNATKLTRRRVLVLLKNSLELVGSDRFPKHWEACLKLSWALVEREMDSPEARAFIATFISTLSATTEPRPGGSFENARYLQTSALLLPGTTAVDLESATQDEIVACLILYNAVAHFLPHRGAPPNERLRELIESITRCGFGWRRENLVRAIRLLVELLPSEARGNPIRGPLRKLILSLPPDIIRECLSTLAESQSTRELIFEERDRDADAEKLANQVIEELCTSKKMATLITATETASPSLCERIVEAVLSFDVLDEFLEETKRKTCLPDSVVESISGIVAAYRGRNRSQVLKAMEILDIVIENTGKFHHRLLLIARVLMEIYSAGQLIEIPSRFLRIVRLGFDVRSYLVSENEESLLRSFLRTVIHSDWLTGLELYLELEEKIPQFPVRFTWDQLGAHLGARGERSDLVLKAILRSFNEKTCLTIDPPAELKFVRDFCCDSLESSKFDQAALDVLLRMDYPDKWSLAPSVALARMEASSEYSKRVTAELLNQCLEFYRIEWLELVVAWFAENASEIGEDLWSEFAVKVEEVSELSPENPFRVKSTSETMDPDPRA